MKGYWKISRVGIGFVVEQDLGTATGMLLNAQGRWCVIGRLFSTEEEAREFAEKSL